MSITNIASQKSVLAKLLATENLTVEHRKVPTAFFDPKNRILTLPIWKNMSSDLYDLLVGHEVGHAWETPPQGWHDAIEAKGKNFKSFLNVVEDARIEKCIKSRYPGLRAPFYRAYQELYDTDFFGVKKIPIKILNLIDRLNLHFKIGSFLNVPFKKSEQVFVQRMENLKDWNDVVSLATDLFKYSKDQPTTSFDEVGLKEFVKKMKDSGQDFDIDDYLDQYDTDSIFPYDDTDGDGDDSKNSSSGTGDDEPYSYTDKKFRQREAELVDDAVFPYVYVNMPDVYLDKLIVNYKDLYKNTDWSKIDNYPEFLAQKINGSDFKDCLDFIESEKVSFSPAKLLTNYRNKNIKFINYLVKEFELKRNAAQMARAAVAKTGELDTDIVWSYKVKDDLFKRVTTIPNGKNHGMVMYVDWSGSMGDNITATLEQTLILADFCKKVGIPFEVFAFSDSKRVSKMNPKINDAFNYQRFSNKDKDLALNYNHLALMNLLSSRMSKTEYRNCQVRLLQFAHIFDRSDDLSLSYDKRHILRIRNSALPVAWDLSGTPLNEAIAAACTFVEKYKKENRLDIVNTIFLTDGDGVDIKHYYQGNSSRAFSVEAGSSRYNIILKDKKSGLTTTANPKETITNALLRMLKLKSSTRLIGYYIMTRASKYTITSVASSYGQSIDADLAAKEIRNKKYFGVKETGYDEYFLVASKDLKIDDSEMDIKPDVNKREMTKEFIKYQKNKVLNRVLLNRFIDMIA